MQQWDFLDDYHAIISCQIFNDHFGDALKTFKKIKYFKLDSTNATDVFEKVKASNLFESFHELTSHTILQKIMQLDVVVNRGLKKGHWDVNTMERRELT